MAKVKFYHRPKGDSGSIWVRISLGRHTESEGGKKYTPLRLSTEITGIKAQQWEKDLCRIVTRSDKSKGREKHEGAVYINGVLDRAEARTLEIAHKAETENRSNEELKNLYLTDEELSIILGRASRPSTPSPSIFDDTAVFLFVEKEIIEKSVVTEHTKKSYRQTLNKMKAFEEFRGVGTSWQGITIDYYNEFVQYLYNKGLSKNTVGSQIKYLKKFLNVARKKGISVCQDYRDDEDFKKPSDNTEAIYLTLEELARIEKVDYSNNPRLDRVRDLFLIACNTGLRLKDLKYLQEEHIQGDIIKMQTSKTGIAIAVPILDQLERVLKKNNNKAPEAISDQRYNEYLKEVAKDAEISDLIVVEDRRQGKLTKIPKSELVTSHTARRTFVSNKYRDGISTESIMKMTGHTTEASFRKYIKTSVEENARDVKKQIEKNRQSNK